MNREKFDLVLVTQKDYVSPNQFNPYIENVLLEDDLLIKALERKGLAIARTSWDDPNFDWANCGFILFRAIWDYYHRFSEFNLWLKQVSSRTALINPYRIIQWNMDKHYLLDLQSKNINIPPTYFLERGQVLILDNLLDQSGWSEAIIKPAIGGAARHTYKFNKTNVGEHQNIFQQLLANEAILFQEYQANITSKGEVSHMVFGGQYSHAVLKKSKAGDFRVQDDFGGSVYTYHSSLKEIAFAEQVIQKCKPFLPVYARIDVMWDNQNQLCVSELELIEPELWLRMNEDSAELMAQALINHMNTPSY